MSEKQPEAFATKAFRALLGLFVYGTTITVVLAALVFWWGAEQFKKPGIHKDIMHLFTVERGDGANTIAMKLYAADLIDDPFIFMIATTILGEHTNLKAGEYAVRPGMSQREIMQMLSAGQTFARRVTIREGLTSYEIVRLLNTQENLSGDITDIPPEGALLPNTYDYQLNEPRTDIIERSANNLLSIVIELCKIKEESEGMGFQVILNQPCGTGPVKTVKDVLTLASIVEKETGQSDERARVAGVFINRLERGMPLQTDPTVIYAITKGKHKNDGKGPLGRRLLRKDLDYDSPYNTYKYPGLPPGPIANAGKASIEAVLNPEEHDYIYFVADGTGGHAFGKTLKEHNANVAKWRKIRRGQN